VVQSSSFLCIAFLLDLLWSQFRTFVRRSGTGAAIYALVVDGIISSVKCTWATQSRASWNDVMVREQMYEPFSQYDTASISSRVLYVMNYLLPDQPIEN